jgi:hypothetical protein
MAPIDSVVEVWLQDKEDAEAASRAVIRKLTTAQPKIEIAGVRIFLTKDTVIRKPLN